MPVLALPAGGTACSPVSTDPKCNSLSSSTANSLCIPLVYMHVRLEQCPGGSKHPVTGMSGSWWVSAPNAAQKYLRGKQVPTLAACTVCWGHVKSTMMERRKAASQAYLQTGCWPCRVLHTHAIFPHNRSESHCREHTCREEHRVEGCSTLDGKHICILAALQGGARLLKWPAGCPNLRSGFVSRNLMLAGVQKRLFAHNLHFSMHAATRAGQRSHLRLHC